ncbi:CRTAC1 family protein [Flavihumibacter sp. UBA7668]|uniref:CRTAC1 family protein n=1 Tax=Flavihumibacter sp. UBA7668 TaxID=1946542 RepID=UPI0025BEF750|nr:CRTAC1 family protein [Flavihumibacter sp. UBA7668]
MYYKLLLVLLFGFTISEIKAQTKFTDVSKEAGIRHVFKVHEGMFGGGAAVLDFNQDGWEDLYITGGKNSDQLYRNNGDGTFSDWFEEAGLSVTRKYITQGVASADINRDGWPDLVVTTITLSKNPPAIPRAINLLFLNKGDGSFRDATAAYGLGNHFSFSTGASFGDFNADGWPDLYIGNYFNQYEGELSKITDATVVGANQIAKGYLYLNEKGKNFREVSAGYGLNQAGFGFGGLFTDYDNDRDQDLYINHDFGYKRTANLFYENKFPGNYFQEIGKQTGMDLKINSMGSAVGDLNNDGWMDYYITNIRFNAFMVNESKGKFFVNRTRELGCSYSGISWGANFADFDQDGDLDLFVSNGDLNPSCNPIGDYYFENTGARFEERARAVGLQDYGIGRGSVVFDYDRDGDLDLFVVNQESVCPDYPVLSESRLYRNDTKGGNWLTVALSGVDAEKNGIGSRVEILAGKIRMIREIDGGGTSHISQNSLLAHFGLGQSVTVDSVIVHWTGGNRQAVTNIKANQFFKIVEIAAPRKQNTIWYILMVAGLLGLGLFIWISRQKKS